MNDGSKIITLSGFRLGHCPDHTTIIVRVKVNETNELVCSGIRVVRNGRLPSNNDRPRAVLLDIVSGRWTIEVYHQQNSSTWNKVRGDRDTLQVSATELLGCMHCRRIELLGRTSQQTDRVNTALVILALNCLLDDEQTIDDSTEGGS